MAAGDNGRKRVSLRLSPECYEGLRSIAGASGVTIQALIEAMCQLFAARGEREGFDIAGWSADPEDRTQLVLRRAREIDQERRAR